MSAAVGSVEEQLDRAAGVLVGAAAGDALGAGYEFGSVCPPEQVEMRRGALTGRAAGSWTDDTDMAMAVAKAAATGQVLIPGAPGLGAVAGGFLDWYRSGPPDIGNQTRAVLASAAAGSGGDPATEMLDAAAIYQGSRPEAAGNGSLMRTGPVALAALGNDALLLESAAAVSSLTHQHRLAVEACGLWCVGIDRAVREARLDGIHDGLGLLEPDRRDYWTSVLGQAEELPTERLRDNGFVVSALQAAWRAVVSTGGTTGPEHFEQGLRTAVAIGGDTDTVAAIAGALLGARYGATSVPYRWRRRLQGWPAGLRPADLVGLAVLAVQRGKPDSIGWPKAEDLTGYYEGAFHPSGRIVELADHPGVHWGDVAGLARAPAESFVSLCRIGRAQRRGDDHLEVWLMDNDHNVDLPFVLNDTADAVETLRRETGSVFVHCVRAESRTPNVAAAWLVRHRGLDPDQAEGAVRAALPQANPNKAMREALRKVAPVAMEGRTVQ